jgi:16S rRNA (adenine1518-N6/adenine1519-N6)-dimethyltransferase
MDRNYKLNKLPSTQALIKSYNLVANKKLGQNFILDSDITDNIALLAGNLRDKTVLEIGPGPGGLTRSILFAEVKKLIAVEIDPRCIAILEQIALSDSRLNIINADAFNIKEEDLVQDEKLTIISNLPYNIGTGLLIKWLDKIELFEQIVIMLQKEVVERIVAQVGNKSYGRLSIFCRSICDCRLLQEIPSYLFFPEPKVDSAVVSLKPKKSSDGTLVDIRLMKRICDGAFNQRRKKVLTSLNKFLSKDDFANLAIDHNLRAEDLSIEQYHKITKYVGCRDKVIL